MWKVYVTSLFPHHFQRPHALLFVYPNLGRWSHDPQPPTYRSDVGHVTCGMSGGSILDVRIIGCRNTQLCCLMPSSPVIERISLVFVRTALVVVLTDVDGQSRSLSLLLSLFVVSQPC